MTSLAFATSKLLGRSLLPGNRLEPLINGDTAYPAMLDAIASGRHSLTLSTYIFDPDEAGLAFAKALGIAVKRGVEVRVLIDATGTRYSWPIPGLLRREDVRYARFLPTFPLWQLLSMNLRNHRKILVAEGRIGFTGGLNIRAGHWLARQPSHPVRDLFVFGRKGQIVKGPMVNGVHRRSNAFGLSHGYTGTSDRFSQAPLRPMQSPLGNRAYRLRKAS